MPINGGMSTDSIFSINKSNNAGRLGLNGGIDYLSGGNLGLYGSSYSGNLAGHFVIGAADGNNTKQLIGDPTGTLTWDNSLILTNQHIKKVSSNGVTGIFSGPTQYEGGSVMLRGATHNETSKQGRASLVGATSTSIWSTINVYPDGKVTLSKPSHNDYASLDDVAVTAKSITSSGYISLTCGLIIQWDTRQATSNGVTYNFPISFTNAVTYINIKWTSYFQSTETYKAGIIANNNSSFTLYGFDTTSRAYYCFAIGY